MISFPKVEQAKSDEIYEEYDDKYEEYDTEVKTSKKVNEQHNGDYEAYNHKYASYLKTSNTHRQVICQKLLKRKWMILSVVLLLLICGIVIGFSIHITMLTTEGI